MPTIGTYSVKLRLDTRELQTGVRVGTNALSTLQHRLRSFATMATGQLRGGLAVAIGGFVSLTAVIYQLREAFQRFLQVSRSKSLIEAMLPPRMAAGLVQNIEMIRKQFGMLRSDAYQAAEAVAMLMNMRPHLFMRPEASRAILRLFAAAGSANAAGIATQLAQIMAKGFAEAQDIKIIRERFPLLAGPLLGLGTKPSASSVIQAIIKAEKSPAISRYIQGIESSPAMRFQRIMARFAETFDRAIQQNAEQIIGAFEEASKAVMNFAGTLSSVVRVLLRLAGVISNVINSLLSVTGIGGEGGGILNAISATIAGIATYQLTAGAIGLAATGLRKVVRAPFAGLSSLVERGLKLGSKPPGFFRRIGTTEEDYRAVLISQYLKSPGVIPTISGVRAADIMTTDIAARSLMYRAYIRHKPTIAASLLGPQELAEYNRMFRDLHNLRRQARELLLSGRRAEAEETLNEFSERVRIYFSKNRHAREQLSLVRDVFMSAGSVSLGMATSAIMAKGAAAAAAAAKAASIATIPAALLAIPSMINVEADLLGGRNIFRQVDEQGRLIFDPTKWRFRSPRRGVLGAAANIHGGISWWLGKNLFGWITGLSREAERARELERQRLELQHRQAVELANTIGQYQDKISEALSSLVDEFTKARDALNERLTKKMQDVAIQSIATLERRDPEFVRMQREAMGLVNSLYRKARQRGRDLASDPELQAMLEYIRRFEPETANRLQRMADENIVEMLDEASRWLNEFNTRLMESERSFRQLNDAIEFITTRRQAWESFQESMRPFLSVQHAVGGALMAGLTQQDIIQRFQERIKEIYRGLIQTPAMHAGALWGTTAAVNRVTELQRLQAEEVRLQQIAVTILNEILRIEQQHLQIAEQTLQDAYNIEITP